MNSTNKDYVLANSWWILTGKSLTSAELPDSPAGFKSLRACLRTIHVPHELARSMVLLICFLLPSPFIMARIIYMSWHNMGRFCTTCLRFVLYFLSKIFTFPSVLFRMYYNGTMKCGTIFLIVLWRLNRRIEFPLSWSQRYDTTRITIRQFINKRFFSTFSRR